MRRPEYLNKDAAAKRSGLSVRRLQELAHRGTIQRRFVKDPRTKRDIAVFAAGDLDRLKQGKPFWKMNGHEILPLSSSDAAAPHSGKTPRETPEEGSLTELVAKFLLEVNASREKVTAAPAAVERLWLTLAEADAYIGLPEGFLLLQVKSGKLPALDVGVRPGGRWRVSKRDLEAIAGERCADQVKGSCAQSPL